MGQTCGVCYSLDYSFGYYVARLMVFENRVLRGMFGPKREVVTWEWGKLHNEELNPLAPNNL
jgi:hypothetical protein